MAKQKIDHKFPELGKIPPQDITIEENILGILLEYFDSVYKLVFFLKKEMFYLEKNQLIFSAMMKLHFNKDPIDVISVTQKLKEMDALEKVGGAYELSRISSSCTKATSIEYHARILHQLYLRRELIALSYDYSTKAYNDANDIFGIINDFVDQIKAINSVGIVSNTKKMKDIISEMSATTSSEIYISESYTIDDPQFDEYITLGKDKILLISGPSGGGKSKFIRYIMFKLLRKYHAEMGVKWVTLEESSKDLIRGFLSNNIKVKPKHIKARRYDPALNQTMLSLYDEFQRYDIEFIEVRTYIRSICDDFRRFCEKRPNKLNVLIIDNILSMDDVNTFQKDAVGFSDYIMGEILKCRQETGGLIIPIHHFKDSQQDKGRIVDGYRPTLTDMKGSEAYRRVPNQVLLTNNPGIYKDLILEYPKELRDILKYTFIVDAGKNREDSNDESNVIRYLINLDFEIFKEM